MEASELEALVISSLHSLHQIMDANTVIGERIDGGNGVSVIPVSRLSCGFLAGGGGSERKREREPFCGGSGAGLQLQPVCFLVISGGQVRLLPICGATALDKVIEAVLPLLDKLPVQRAKKDSVGDASAAD